jgi:hypothetical protein
MTYDVNIPAAVPRTLVRTPQLNPILAMFRGSQPGTFLKSTAAGVMQWDQIGSADISGGIEADDISAGAPGTFLQTTPAGAVVWGDIPPTEISSISGATTVDVSPVVPADDGAWTIASSGSAASAPGNTATWEGMRDALLWLNDTRESSIDSAALVIDVREDVAGPLVARTGIHSKAFTRPDRGESSAGLFVQTGGGSSLTTYKAHRMRPDGKPNLSYSHQGALEVATQDMGFGILAQSGAGFSASAGNPDPTLSGAIDASVTTIGLSQLLGFPPPGGATVYPAGAPATWPTPLYARIDAEVISYTGLSHDPGVSGPGNLLSCVRGVNSTAAAHAAGAAVVFICASNAILLRLENPISKGIVVVPSDGVSFDGRPALSVGINNHGQPQELSARLVIRMNGAIESSTTISATTSISTAQLNAANANVTGRLELPHIVGSGAAPSIAAGAGAGTGPTVQINGSDTAGHITVTTGTTPGTNAVICTVTFGLAFTAAPRSVILTPANAAAKLLTGAGQVWVDAAADRATTSFSVRSGATALTASTAYQFYYLTCG